MSRLRKQATIADEYGQEYSNQYGKVTPYHILFKDHGNEIAALSDEGAKQYCLDTIESLNEQYAHDDAFYKVIDQEKEDFIQSLNDDSIDSGMDILFIVKDYLLRTEGLETEASRLKKK